MRNFIKRNSPVIFIGIITLVVFLIIIGLAQTKEHKQPNLIKIGKEALFTTREEEIQVQIDENTNEQLVGMGDETQDVNESTPGDVDRDYGVLEIVYTEEGFNPKNAKAQLNQLVRWKNDTDKSITLIQKTVTYPEFSEGTLVRPGEILEFRVYKTKLWTYREVGSDSFGSIFVSKECTECLNQPL